MIRKLLKLSIVFFIFGIFLGGIALTWGYFYFSRDLPSFEKISNYQPDATSFIYSEQGTLLAEVYEERRYMVHLKDVPKNVINAFLAAEDSEFYNHPGIDIFSILRALYANIKAGSVSQGGSTITQQVVKNLLLTREKKLERKIKEALLAFKIERALSKDQILELYLNQIFLGNTAYGIQAAARLYYHKELADLTIAEAAILAGLPKAPSRFSPISSPEDAKRRQRYVLGQMRKSNFISQKEYREALNEKLKFYRAVRHTVYNAPYYVAEVKYRFKERWPQYNLERDGLKVFTALNDDAEYYSKQAVHKGLREVDKRRGWRGPIENLDSSSDLRSLFIDKYRKQISFNLKTNKPYPALVTNVKGTTVTLDLGYFNGKIDLKKSQWARKFLNSQDKVSWIKPESLIKQGSIVEVGITKELDFEKFDKIKLIEQNPQTELVDLELDQTPIIQAAFTIINPHNGKVLTTIGGYDYYQSEFNRVTQSLRQPGSAFKPIVYLTAIDAFSYTPTTIVYDEPRSFRVGKDFWTPRNFDGKYMGAITLRDALERSRNTVSADIIARIGVDPVLRYAKSMGIESTLGRNLSLSLGSGEVTPLEITRAYGVMPAKGVFNKSIFITKIIDRFENVIYDYKQEALKNSRQVVNEKTAFVMSNLMKGVVESGTGWRIKELKRPAAGKTGTSNEQMDGWFVGFTPDYVAGAWVGFDTKIKIGEKETGGAVAAPIWLYALRDFLNSQEEQEIKKLSEIAKKESLELGIEYIEPKKPESKDFTAPEGVESYWIDKRTGNPSEKGAPGAILEYFLPNTYKPTRQDSAEISYWDLE